MSDESRAPSTPLDRLRWPLRLGLMVLVPVILLLVLEGALRLTGFGYDTRIFKPVPGLDRVGSNAQFGYRYFPRAIARTPLLFSFSPEKPENHYRIFILGASAAAGVPNSVTAFAQILDEMLESRYPGVEFEVINTGMPAINSHVVRGIAAECAGYEPDLFLVYLGNNEAIGPFNAGTAEQRKGMTSARVQTIVGFRRTKIGQLVQGLGEKLGGADKVPEKWGGMSMYMDNTFRPEDAAMQLVADNFRENLTAIVQAGQEAGAEVLLSTVAVNLKDNAPFASLHRADLSEADRAEFEKLYRRAAASEAAGALDQAAAGFAAALAVDQTHAEAHFRLGRALLQEGDADAALEHFRRALARDALPFRTTDRLNEIIRAVAGARGAALVDCEDLLLQQARRDGTLPGMDHFYEHVHLNYAGNYLLAGFMFQEVARLLPEDIRRLGETGRPLPSAEDCARDLALTSYDRYNMLSHMMLLVREAPFTNQYNYRETLDHIQSGMARLKEASSREEPGEILAVYQAAVRRRPKDLLLRFNYAKLLRALGQNALFEREMEHINGLIPPGFEEREPAR